MQHADKLETLPIDSLVPYARNARTHSPEQVAAVVARHPEIRRARLVVTNPDSTDHMLLLCEAEPPAVQVDAVVASLRDLTKLRGDVRFVESGSLPNDGKVISDERKLD